MTEESTMTVAQAKAEARALRTALAAQGQNISHAASLELVAKRHGARDWNTLRARLAQNEKPVFVAGARVSGRYLSQPFAGTIVSAHELTNGMIRLDLRFDSPVDVVRFESFSSLRQRIRADVTAEGESTSKTSDGRPHLELDLPISP